MKGFVFNALGFNTKIWNRKAENLLFFVNQTGFVIEYFAGMKKGDFYEEPVEGEYPDW